MHLLNKLMQKNASKSNSNAVSNFYQIFYATCISVIFVHICCIYCSELFQKLFRQDLLVASLFRNFLLAERIMRSYNCSPVSMPKLPPTFQHPMWQVVRHGGLWVTCSVKRLLVQLHVMTLGKCFNRRVSVAKQSDLVVA